MRKAKDSERYVSPEAKYLKKKSYILYYYLIKKTANLLLLFLFVLDDDCRKRYKNIKDAYLKNKRTRKMTTGSSASSKPSKWYLAPFLTFLDTVPQERM